MQTIILIVYPHLFNRILSALEPSSHDTSIVLKDTIFNKYHQCCQERGIDPISTGLAGRLIGKMFPCALQKRKRWNGQNKLVLSFLQWKESETKELLLKDFNVPNTYFKIQETDDSVKFGTFTGHKLNGVRLLKEVTVNSDGQWQVEIANRAITAETLGLSNVVAKNAESLHLILSTVEHSRVCEGATVDGAFSPTNMDNVETWEYDMNCSKKIHQGS